MSTTGTPANPWFVCPRPDARAPLRLFCFPYAGGGTPIYRAWPAALEGVAEVHLAQLPGRERRLREPPRRSLDALAAELAEAIVPHLGPPFAFFGHSMGALVAFELARRLRRERGVEPRHLFVSGRRAPQFNGRERRTFDLPEDEFVRELLSLNGTPPEVLEHPELRMMVLPLLRADFEVCQTYEFEPGPPLGCPVTALGGADDPQAPLAELDGWREQTSNRFALRVFAGDHFFLNQARAEVLEALAGELRAAAGGA